MKKPTERKSKPSKGKKKVVGSDSAPSPFNPLSHEKFMSDSDVCMTKVTFDKPFVEPMILSADEIFANAKVLPGTLVEPLFWYFILPWLRNEPVEIKSFWKKYDTPAALKGRRRAVSGTKLMNYSEERVVIGLVKEVMCLCVPSMFPLASGAAPLMASLNPNSEMRSIMSDQIVKKLGIWVLNAVMNDHEAPRRMHRLLKNPNAADDPKGDQLSFNGKIFAAFVKLVGTNRMLPTKMCVRRKAGLSDEQKDISAASEVFKMLGLSGLPQG